MIDPHLMLLLMRLLGKEYLVWDKSAKIEFVTASRKKVMAVIRIAEEDLEAIRRHTEKGDKYFARFFLEIRDEGNELVAKVEKVIYVRKKAALNKEGT